MKKKLLLRFVLEFNKSRQDTIESSKSRLGAISYKLVYWLEIVSILHLEASWSDNGINQYSRRIASYFHVETISKSFNIPLEGINITAFAFIVFVVAALLREIYLIAKSHSRSIIHEPTRLFRFIAKHVSYIARYLILIPVLQVAFQIIIQDNVQGIISTWELVSKITAITNIVLIMLLALLSEYFSFPPAFGDQSLIPRSQFNLTLFELSFILASTGFSAAQLFTLRYAQIASYLILILFASETIWLSIDVRFYRSHLHKCSLLFNAIGLMYCISYIVKIQNLKGSNFTELPLLLLPGLIYKLAFSLFQRRLKQAFERPTENISGKNQHISALELLAFYAHSKSQDDVAFFDNIYSIMYSKKMLIDDSSLKLNTRNLFGEGDTISDQTYSQIASLILQDRARKTVLNFIDALLNLKLNDYTYQSIFSVEDVLIYISFLVSVNFQEVQALKLIALTKHKLNKEEAKISFIQYCQIQSFEEYLETTINSRRTNTTLSVSDVLQAVRESLASKRQMREYLDAKLRFLGYLLEPNLQMKILAEDGRKLLQDEQKVLAQLSKGTESLESRHLARIFILDVLENNDELIFTYKYPFVLKAQKSLESDLIHRSISKLDFKLAINSLESNSEHRIDMLVRSNGHHEEEDLKKINEKFLLSLGYSVEDRDKLAFNDVMPGYFPNSKDAFTKDQKESIGVFFARKKQSYLKSFETFRVYEVLQSDVFEVYYMRRDQNLVSKYLLIKDNGSIVGVSGTLGKIFEETGVLSAINNLEGRPLDDILTTGEFRSIMSTYDQKAEDKDHLGYILSVTERSTKDWMRGNQAKIKKVKLEVIYRMTRFVRDDGVEYFMVDISIIKGLTEVFEPKSDVQKAKNQTVVHQIASQISGKALTMAYENENMMSYRDLNTDRSQGITQSQLATLESCQRFLEPPQNFKISLFDEVIENDFKENVRNRQVPAKILEIEDYHEENESHQAEKLKTQVQAISDQVEDESKSEKEQKMDDKIQKKEATSIHSSRSSSTTQKLKEMRNSLTNVEPPLVLTALQIFGFFVTISLITLIAADYVIINQKYSNLSTFADLATYPSTLVSLMSKFHACSELFTSATNNSLYTTSFTNDWIPLVQSSIKTVYKDFLTTYMDKAINLGPEEVFPAFISSSFSIDLYFEDPIWNIRVEFHEAIEVANVYMETVSENINKTNTTNLVDLEFFRQNILNYSTMLNNVSETLFNQLFTTFDMMTYFLKGTLVAGILMPSVLVVIFMFIYDRFEKQEGTIISMFSKIPNASILPEIEHLTSLKAFFPETLVNTFELQTKERLDNYHASQAQFSKEKKSKRFQSTKNFKKDSKNCCKMSFVLLLYALVYSIIFIPLYTIQKTRTLGMQALVSQKKNFADSYKSFATVQSVWMQTVSYAAAESSSDVFEWMNQTASLFSRANDYESILSNLFLSSSAIWATDDLNDQLKAIMDVLTHGNICSLEPNSTIIADQCPTVFNDITSQGLLASYKEYLGTTQEFVNMLLANLTSSTLLNITQSDTFMGDWVLWSVVFDIFDLVLVDFDSNLQDISTVSSQQMNTFIILGVIVYVFLYIFTWMPILKWIQNRYMFSRRLFTILPSTILIKNAYIKKLFNT